MEMELILIIYWPLTSRIINCTATLQSYCQWFKTESLDLSFDIAFIISYTFQELEVVYDIAELPVTQS